MMGGAFLQHSPVGGVWSAAASTGSSESLRWMIQMWSWLSAQTPIVWPMYQPFGSGLGHIGSTSKRGAEMPLPPCASAFFSSTLWLTPSAARRATNPAPMKTLRRFITCLLLLKPGLTAGDELLDALAMVLLACVDVASRVDGDAADRQEATRLTATLPDGSGRSERIAIEDDDLLVLPVRDEQEPLLRVVREGDVPRGAKRRHRTELPWDDSAKRVLRNNAFLHELAVFLEDLDAVAGAVADVDHVVLRDVDTGHVAELASGRGVRIVGARVGTGLLAVRAPGALELPALAVEHRDPAVAGVGDEHFIRCRIDSHRGRLVQVIVACGLSRVADLEEELTGLGEFDDLTVSGSCRGGRGAAASA